MKWSIEKEVSLGFGLALLILIIIGVVSYRSTNKLIESAGQVAHTNRVLTRVIWLKDIVRVIPENGQPKELIGVMIDITEQKRVEEELRKKNALVELLRVTAVASNEALTTEEAMQTALDEVCAYTGWPIGHVYIINENSGELIPTNIWRMENPARFETFRKITEETRFAPEKGLPGRILVSGKPAWIVDVTKDENFPRARQMT